MCMETGLWLAILGFFLAMYAGRGQIRAIRGAGLRLGRAVKALGWAGGRAAAGDVLGSYNHTPPPAEKQGSSQG